MSLVPALPLLYFENVAGQVLVDPAGFLRINWSKQARGANDAAQLFENLLRGLQQRRWSRVLINQLGMRPFSPDEQQWIANDWLPRAVREGGYRHGAVLVSADVLVRLATAFVTTSVQGLPLVYRSFDAEFQAVRWLAQQAGAPLS